jgi:hypothetical protein
MSKTEAQYSTLSSLEQKWNLVKKNCPQEAGIDGGLAAAAF